MNPQLFQLLDSALWLLVAAAVMAAGMLLLYLALGFYGLVLTKFINQIGVTAAFIEYCRDKRNRGARWQPWLNWTIRKWRDGVR